MINYDVALAIATRLAEMARKHQLNQCINSCTSCTTVCIMAASLLLCSGPGRPADRSLQEDGQPCMSEEFKQAALQLLVMAVNEGLLDEKSFETHKNMIQIVGGRSIRIIRRPQEPAPVAAVLTVLELMGKNETVETIQHLQDRIQEMGLRHKEELEDMAAQHKEELEAQREELEHYKATCQGAKGELHAVKKERTVLLKVIHHQLTTMSDLAAENCVLALLGS